VDDEALRRMLAREGEERRRAQRPPPQRKQHVQHMQHAQLAGGAAPAAPQARRAPRGELPLPPPEEPGPERARAPRPPTRLWVMRHAVREDEVSCSRIAPVLARVATSEFFAVLWFALVCCAT